MTRRILASLTPQRSGAFCNRFGRWGKLAAAATLALATLGPVGGCQQQKPETKAAEAIPAGAFTRKWLAQVKLDGGDSVANLYAREDLLIVYTKEHKGYVFNRESGGFMWLAPITNPGTKVRPPVVLKDYVVFPTVSTLEVYDRATGRNHRTVHLDFALRSGAVGAGTHIYFGADDQTYGRLVNLDLAGSQYQHTSTTWTLATRGGIASTPAVFQGAVFVGDDRGDVYAVNAENRAPVWPTKQEGREVGVFGSAGAIRADLKADEFGVYVPSQDTKLYCLGRTDGRIRWQYFAGQPIDHSPVITATTLYQFIAGQGIIAIDKAKGDYNRKPLWTVKEGVQFLAEDDRYAYLEGGDHSVIAVERKTGEVKFRSKRKDFFTFATAVKGNVVYAASESGELRAIVPVLTAGSMGEVVQAPSSAEAFEEILAAAR